jgi:hypothetical protein
MIKLNELIKQTEKIKLELINTMDTDQKILFCDFIINSLEIDILKMKGGVK